MDLLKKEKKSQASRFKPCSNKISSRAVGMLELKKQMNEHKISKFTPLSNSSLQQKKKLNRENHVTNFNTSSS